MADSTVGFLFDRRTLRFLIDVDVLVNETLTGNRRTVSAELGGLLARGNAPPWVVLACISLDRFEPNHCQRSYERSASP